jgi:hypothetical protein
MELILSAFFLLAIPLFTLLFFKSNGGILFLAACAGIVLLNSLDPVVVTTAGAIVPGEGEAYIRLAVVMLSIVFSGLVFRRTIKGSALILNGIIVLFTSLMLWVTLPGATGVSWLIDSIDSEVWLRANDFSSLIIAAGLSLSLVSLLIGQKKEHKKSKH